MKKRKVKKAKIKYWDWKKVFDNEDEETELHEYAYKLEVEGGYIYRYVAVNLRGLIIRVLSSSMVFVPKQAEK
jgi:predicted SAM-dependent methyltransferase